MATTKMNAKSNTSSEDTVTQLIDPVDIKEEINIKVEEKEEEKEEVVLNTDIIIKQEIVDVDDSEASNTFQNVVIPIKLEDIKAEVIDLEDVPLSKRLESTGYRDEAKKAVVPIPKNNVTLTPGSIKVVPLSKICISQNNIASDATKTLEVEIKKEPACDCMRNVENLCSQCNKTTIYQKEIKQCLDCNALLKLQCKLCNKKYKVLDKALNKGLPVKPITSVPRQREIVFLDHDYGKPASNYKHQKSKTDNNSCKTTANNNYRKINTDHNDESDVGNTRTEQEEQTFSCPQCIFKTARKGILDIHIAKSHKVTTVLNPNDDDDMFIEFLCLKCQKTYRKVSYDNVTQQKCRDCQEVMSFRCSLCHKVSKLLKNIRYHVRCNCYQRVNREKVHCDHCLYKTEEKKRLEYHINMNHTPKPCPNCHREFENIIALKKHVNENLCLRESPGKTIGTIIESIPVTKHLKRNNFSTPYRDDECLIVKNNADVVIKKIERKPPKTYSVENWRILVDYMCLQCGEGAKKKFSRYRPWCPNCKIKYDYRCISCEKLYGAYARIHKHVKTECHARMTFDCPFCSFNASKKNLLAHHIRSKHTIFKCLRCDNNLEGYQALKKHQSWECLMEDTHGRINYKKLVVLYCKQCSRQTISTESGAVSECDICFNLMSYQCLKCTRMIASRESMYKHVKECKPKFCCEQCEFRSYNEQEFDLHVKFRHIDRICPDCGVHFLNEDIFKLHRLEELKKKKLTANDCFLKLGIAKSN